MPVTFADFLPVESISTDRFAVELKSEWCTGTVPNGGYLCSSLMIAARTFMQLNHPESKQCDPFNIHVEYLRRSQAGPAIILVRPIKLGRRTSVLHLSLLQGDTASGAAANSVIEGYVGMTKIAAEAGLSMDTAYTLSPPPLPIDLERLTATGENANYTLRGKEPFSDFRRAAANVQMYLVKPSARPGNWPSGMCDQWLRLCVSEEARGRWTNDALGFLVDMFPHIIETHVNRAAEEKALMSEGLANQPAATTKATERHTTHWYPTLTLTVDVKKRLPEEGLEFVFSRVRAKRVKNGRFDLDVEVWDDQGEIVAIGHHTGLVMDVNRNTAKPSKTGHKL